MTSYNLTATFLEYSKLRVKIGSKKVLTEGKDEAVVRALVPHKCGPGSNRGVNANVGVEFVVGSQSLL